MKASHYDIDSEEIVLTEKIHGANAGFCQAPDGARMQSRNCVVRLSDQIRAAAKRLTSETWIKGTLFDEKGGALCMCAHGAMQTECNPSIRCALIGNIPNRGRIDDLDMLVNNTVIYPKACEPMGAIRFAAERALAVEMTNAIRSGFRRSQAWEDRPNWVRDTDPERGNLEAHYLLGMVGLTESFNDDPKTTLEQILEKFEEAAKIAEILGV